MPLALSPASKEDLPRLVQILFSAFAAFASDSLLMTYYPTTPSNHTWWVQTILSQMQHASASIMKVVDEETGDIISLAMWFIRQEHMLEQWLRVQRARLQT